MNTEIKKVFLSGICGTAMASLAGMLSEAGYSVSGSDQAVYPPMSTFLEGLGIPVTEGFSETNIKKAAPDLVVIGNTLSRGNPEIEYVLDEGLFYKSMAETVKEFFIRDRRSTVVAGTHGKTTTTALLAWLLHSGGLDPSFLVGGIAENFQSSYRIGGGGDFVIEGDEYDTAFFDKGPKFLHYLPNVLLIKNIEFDHTDIYRDLEAIQLSFQRLINIVPRSGLIVAGIESPAVRDLLADAPAPVQTFGLASGDWSVRNIHVEGGGTRFDVLREERLWHTVWTPLVGEFNVSNALSAVIAAHHLGLSKEAIQVALTGFKNVRRRLEIRGEESGITVYDDFAHPPDGRPRNTERRSGPVSGFTRMGRLRTALSNFPSPDFRKRIFRRSRHRRRGSHRPRLLGYAPGARRRAISRTRGCSSQSRWGSGTCYELV